MWVDVENEDCDKWGQCDGFTVLPRRLTTYSFTLHVLKPIYSASVPQSKSFYPPSHKTDYQLDCKQEILKTSIIQHNNNTFYYYIIYKNTSKMAPPNNASKWIEEKLWKCCDCTRQVMTKRTDSHCVECYHKRCKHCKRETVKKRNAVGRSHAITQYAQLIRFLKEYISRRDRANGSSPSTH